MEEKGTTLSRYEVQDRLIRMIMEMSDTERKELLIRWEQYRQNEMREYPRKPALIPVDCSSFEACFTDFIQDISSGGVFIQTDGHFFVGQQITLTFTIPKAEEDISVSGEVIRVNTRGIGVRFNEPLPIV